MINVGLILKKYLSKFNKCSKELQKSPKFFLNSVTASCQKQLVEGTFWKLNYFQQIIICYGIAGTSMTN